MAASSSKAVIAAVFGNGFLACIKFAAFLLSGSGAMLSEAIHSVADTGNQSLLYLGIRRSDRTPDRMFHYGYGAERFFYALMSAVGIFVLGCGVTIYHGVHTFLHPPELHVSWITWVVLALAFAVDGAVFLLAVRAVNRERGNVGFLEFIRTSSDPTVLAVLFEDFIASMGVLVAAGGIALSWWTGDTRFDAASSIIIGLMLGGVAMWLGWRNRQLILGPAIPADVEARARELITAQPSVSSIQDVKTRVLAADRFRLKAEVDYDGRYLGGLHAEWLRARLADGAEVAEVSAEFGERVLNTLSEEVDRIESVLFAEIPRLKHLDFEIDERDRDDA